MEVPVYPNYIEESKLINDFLQKNPNKKNLTVERIINQSAKNHKDKSRLTNRLTELLDFFEIDYFLSRREDSR